VYYWYVTASHTAFADFPVDCWHTSNKYPRSPHNHKHTTTHSPIINNNSHGIAMSNRQRGRGVPFYAACKTDFTLLVTCRQHRTDHYRGYIAHLAAINPPDGRVWQRWSRQTAGSGSDEPPVGRVWQRWSRQSAGSGSDEVARRPGLAAINRPDGRVALDWL